MMKKVIYLVFAILLFQAGFAAKEVKEQFEPGVWEQVNNKFLIDSIPIRYYSNILIKLLGNPSQEDQIIIQELTDTLNSLIDVWDVAIIPEGTANLLIEINDVGNRNLENHIQERNNGREIIQNKIILNIPQKLNYEERRKIIYYYFMHSIVYFHNKDSFNNYAGKRIKGLVFDEKSPASITYHPIDFKIIKALYSKIFDDIYKFSPRKTSLYKPTKPEVRVQYTTLFNLIGLLIAAVYLIVLSYFKVFKEHNYDFILFLRQGFLIYLAYASYVILKMSLLMIFTYTTFKYQYIVANIGGTFIVVMISIITIYFVEYFIISKKKENLYLNVFIPFVSTTMVPSILMILFLMNIPDVMIRRNVVISASTSGIAFCSIIGIARAFYIYLSLSSKNIIRQKDVQLARLNQLHKQSELQSLQSKINPHFLYNALNSIASLSTVDGKKTEKMALALSDFFKYSLNKEQKEMVSLKEEIESVETYLTIEKVRFGDRLNFAIQLPEELENITIPQFIIQPLIENAVKHGISKIVETGEIRLVVSAKNNNLEVRVFDNGPAISNEPISGYGLQSIQEKLNLIYGNKAYMSWNNEPEKYVLISLPLNDKS